MTEAMVKTLSSNNEVKNLAGLLLLVFSRTVKELFASNWYQDMKPQVKFFRSHYNT